MVAGTVLRVSNDCSLIMFVMVVCNSINGCDCYDNANDSFGGGSG